jgi:hypothetical protein
MGGRQTRVRKRCIRRTAGRGVQVALVESSSSVVAFTLALRKECDLCNPREHFSS